MKKAIALAVASAALFGCQSVSNNDASSAQEAAYNQSIDLKSALWFNKMPTIDDAPEMNLHGSLVLEQSEGFSAELDITRVELHQAKETYLIDQQQFELRSHSENQWEAAFALPIELDENKTVDVVVYFTEEGKQSFVAEKGVAIEVVY
ncbi:hypothetical protein [Vibrio agarivorans]|uniref:hypothetical protein n=1 Tax=Vibrio agarivorans TaxID=153622 RepID=UPI0022307DAA|nr:hypothetical protein [Vibrio agarivorans]MDN3662538.1 hypothetical protein [Vibrio agarivorans]